MTTTFAVRSTVECLYSTMRNISSDALFFGFLPPHGRLLDAGEEITVWGDIQAHVLKNGRKRRSLENALDGGPDSGTAVLALSNSPAVHLFDLGADETKILTLASGTFTAADPCWGAYSSSA